MFAKAADYLQPVRNIAKFFGTLPGRSLHDPTVTLSYRIYQFVLLAISANSMYKKMGSHFYAYKDIVCFTFILTDFTGFVRHAAIILNPVTLQKVYTKLWRKLERVEKIMHAQNMAQKQCPTNGYLYTSITVAISTMFIFGYVTYANYDRDVTHALGLVVTHATFLSCTVHVITLASLVKNKFQLLNWHLDYLNNKVPLYLLPDEAKILLANKTQGERVKEKFVDYRSNVREATVDKIRAFNQLHFLLYSSCHVVNKYFSLALFFCVIDTALDMICTCIEVFDGDSIDSPLDMIFLVVSCYEFMQIFLIANLYHNIRSESEWTAQLVCYLLDEDEHSEDVGTESFSKELITRKVYFTAFGFFDVNLKMITSMVGLTLPVTLFLVQYNNKQQASSKA